MFISDTEYEYKDEDGKLAKMDASTMTSVKIQHVGKFLVS